MFNTHGIDSFLIMNFTIITTYAPSAELGIEVKGEILKKKINK